MKLNLGCGKDIREGYVNIDIHNFVGVDLVRDVSDLTWIETNSVSKIVARDIIEHFPRSQAEPVLREWYRVLDHGGKMFMSCPDIERICERYLGIKQPKLDANYVAYLLYGDELPEYLGEYHKNIFDKESMTTLLKKVQFVNIIIENDPGANLIINCEKR